MTGAAGQQRIDKWLFFARIVKSRSLAQKLALSGQVRVNREKIADAAKIVRPGDVLTITLERGVRILRLRDAGLRRGPAPEAQRLYEDLTPPAAPVAAAGAGELSGYAPSQAPPTKRERRALERLRWSGEA